MELNIIDTQVSLVNCFLAELRNKEVHSDRMRFRRNLERVGEVIAYEISKTFRYQCHTVETPINPAQVMLPEDEIVVASVLRAGLPFHQGFLNYMDHAGSAFISARRVFDEQKGFVIRYDSVYTPLLEGKQLLLVDPMLATGSSLVVAYRELLKQGGQPRHTHIAAVVASKQGIRYLQQELGTAPVTLWVGTVDERLTEKSYIDPGLGDAGDLAFGEKI